MKESPLPRNSAHWPFTWALNLCADLNVMTRCLLYQIVMFQNRNARFLRKTHMLINVSPCFRMVTFPLDFHEAYNLYSEARSSLVQHAYKSKLLMGLQIWFPYNVDWPGVLDTFDLDWAFCLCMLYIAIPLNLLKPTGYWCVSEPTSLAEPSLTAKRIAEQLLDCVFLKWDGRKQVANTVSKEPS
jgi:hypothetical protein